MQTAPNPAHSSAWPSAGQLATKLRLAADAELVEIFGHYDQELGRMHDLMVQCWVAQHQIRPAFAIQDKVLVTIGGGLGPADRQADLRDRRAACHVRSGDRQRDRPGGL